MPDSAGAPEGADSGGLDAVVENLYGRRPDDFVAARDDAVARARERGDRQLASAIGRLRRPTRAAWLANLLARQRGEQLDGLLALAADLAAAQRTLDGGALRALSTQRNRLVAAMVREAARLAHAAGDAATDPVLRELGGILEAALADPAVGAEVRSGRLTRTLAYSGFGPAADPRAVPQPRARSDVAAGDREGAEREHGRRERDRTERERALATAEQEEAAAVRRQDAQVAARDDAAAAHAAAREHVAELVAELEAAREQERGASAAARSAETAAKESARAAGAAATRTAQARARLDEDDRG